jgi:hypothetical protein
MNNFTSQEHQGEYQHHSYDCRGFIVHYVCADLRVVTLEELVDILQHGQHREASQKKDQSIKPVSPMLLLQFVFALLDKESTSLLDKILWCSLSSCAFPS